MEGRRRRAALTLSNDALHPPQPELLRVLYPVLVHCYLQLVLGGHGEAARALLSAQRGEHAPQEHELSQLALLTEPGHVHASPLAQNFLLARYGVQLSRYSFTLLLSFLQQESSHSPLTLALVNEHLQLTQLPGEPCTHQEVPVAPRTGLAPQTVRPLRPRTAFFPPLPLLTPFPRSWTASTCVACSSGCWSRRRWCAPAGWNARREMPRMRGCPPGTSSPPPVCRRGRYPL